MDANHFDALTRALDPGSRRRVLEVLGGVALGAVASLRGQRNGAAKKKRKKKKCKGKKKKCGKKCIPKSNCCKSTECGGGAICQSGACTCPDGPPVSCGTGECDCDEVCKVDDVGSDPPVCQGGGCPTTDFCSDTFVYACGEGCHCATSVDGASVCAELLSISVACQECASDAECTAALELPSACIPLGEFCDCAPAVTAFCVPIGCPNGSQFRAKDKPGRSRGGRQ